MPRRSARSPRRTRSLLFAAALMTVALAPVLGGQAPALAIDGSLAKCDAPFYDQLETVLLGPLKALGVNPPDPGWELVDQVNPLRELTGRVQGKSRVTETDFPASHDSHDLNFDVVVDGPYRPLVADHEPDIEIEWETGNIPEWAWPDEGDRVWVNGNWIFDCGHPNDQGLFKTEIHPPRAVASMREQVRTMPGSGSTPVRVTATDLYIHGRGGFVTDVLHCGMDVLLVNPNPETGCFAAIEPFPHRGTPIDTNFEFFVNLPPKPASAPLATLAVSIENGPGNTLPQAADVTAIPENSDNPTQLRVRIPLAGSGASPDDVYARKIVAGWLAPPDNLHHFRVNLTEGIAHNDQDPEGSDCECTFFWMNVDKAGSPGTNEWVRLAGFDVPTDDNASFPCEQDDNTLGSWDDELSCGEGNLNFNGPQYDFYVADSAPFTVKFHGYDQDCFDSVFGPPHNLFVQGPLLLNCYIGPPAIAEPGDNDDMGVVKQTFSAPGYADSSRSAGNGNYTMNFNVDDVPLTNEDSSDLAAAKSCAPDPVKAGTPYTCTIEVTNQGPGLPRDVVVTDTLATAVDPAEYNVGSATVTWQGVAKPPAPAPCEVSPDLKVTCRLGSVPLAPAKAVITVQATSLQGGDFTDNATVTTASTDPSGGNNTASNTVTVIPQADLRVAKAAAPSPVLAGGDLTYTVTTTNDGPSTAQNVSLSDVLPPSTEFKSATPSAGGTCTTPPVGSTGTVTCTWSGPTARGESRSVNIVVEVAGPGFITDTASTTSATEDPDLSDNKISIDTEVICTITGTPGNDELQGTDGFDVICGLGGNDTIHAGSGDDRVFGGSGKDSLFGDAGNDMIRGEAGDDVLVGGDGNDKLRGEAGNDVLQGERGIDILDAGPDTDSCTDPANEPGTAIGCERGP